MAQKEQGPVILFGYDSSPFTNKVRLALRVKQIPFSYVPVPSMLPRPLLTSTFGLSYRKIPILAIGREIYCDTSLIIEALEHYFPTSQGYGSVYPKFEGLDEWAYKGLARGFASFWTDKPLFRTTTGLIPPDVWSSSFGTDRAQLIGHQLDPSKLGAKIPSNLSNLDLHLSLLEPTFRPTTQSSPASKPRKSPWVIPTPSPSLADISLYYQLRWGIDIAAGKGIYNLSGGGVTDTNKNITAPVFNATRYPGLWSWFHAFEEFIASLPDREVTIAAEDTAWKARLQNTPLKSNEEILVPTPVMMDSELDKQRGLVVGAEVSVVPDDTGRGNPTVGTVVAIGVEEVVLRSREEAEMEVHVHFPRLGFLVRTVDGSRL